MPTDSTPRVPGDLDATAKTLYRFLRRHMRERPDGPTQWQDPDHQLLSQACRYEMRARRARDGFSALDSDALTTVGDRKQLTVHPVVKIAEQAERAFVDCLKELGFTPTARARLGLEKAKAGPSKFGFD
jgi:P27 family predicted phage terminase small subunit